MNEYSKEFLLDLYQTMLEIRLTEESFVDPILNQEIRCPVHLYSGQEAVATGVCATLTREDYVFGNHRSHGHFIAKGGSIAELIAEVYCRETGCSRGRGGSMHLIDPEVGMMGSAPIVSGTISLALGAALAASIRNDNRVSVCFFGDGATGEGVLYESMNFAALKNLPLIFVCENNLYATHMPIREIRTQQHIHQIAEPFGIESREMDGNKVLDVYENSASAVEKCRRGKGPVFFECLTYRQRGHVGPNDNIQGTQTDIRPEAEVAKWLQNDPIQRYESELLKAHAEWQSELDHIRNTVEQEVSKAHEMARNSPHPEIKELMHYVFA